MLGGIIFSAAAPSFSKQPLLPPQQSVPASLWPCLPCFKHSPPEDTVFRGTRFHHTSAPMPRPHSPAASSQTAQCRAMANTRALKLQSSSPAEGKETGQHHRPEGGPHQETCRTGRTFEHNSPGAPGASPAPFFGADLVSATGLCPQGPRGSLPEGQGGAESAGTRRGQSSKSLLWPPGHPYSLLTGSCAEKIKRGSPPFPPSGLKGFGIILRNRTCYLDSGQAQDLIRGGIPLIRQRQAGGWAKTPSGGLGAAACVQSSRPQPVPSPSADNSRAEPKPGSTSAGLE